MQQTPTLDKRVLDALAAWGSSRHDDWASGFLGLIRRWVPWFDAERIEYAFDDTVAVQLHGGDPQGTSALLLMTPSAWERVCQTADATTIVTRQGNLGSLTVEGSGHSSSVFFLESLEGIRVLIQGVWVVSLNYFIDNALLHPELFDREIVISLIRANELDETFQKSLSTRSRRAHYLACLGEARQQGAKG
jgi:hypothetical protein